MNVCQEQSWHILRGFSIESLSNSLVKNRRTSVGCSEKMSKINESFILDTHGDWISIQIKITDTLLRFDKNSLILLSMLR